MLITNKENLLKRTLANPCKKQIWRLDLLSEIKRCFGLFGLRMQIFMNYKKERAFGFAEAPALAHTTDPRERSMYLA